MATTELAIPEVATEELEVHLAARNTEEMHLAKTQLHDWLTAKIKMAKHEAGELSDAHDIAKKRKWGTETLKRHAELAKKRLTFYQKVMAAVDAGYTIVPNFPVDLFAIRTKRQVPIFRRYSADGAWQRPHVPTVEVKALPEAEGRYVSDIQRGHASERELKNEKGETFTRHYFDVTSYGEVEFPIACARPVIMEAAAQAMALKVFDAVGICPQRTVRTDPLIIGQVRMPKIGWQPKIVSFLIAWHLDLRTL